MPPADKTIKFWTWTVTTEQQQQQPPSASDDPSSHPAKKQKKQHQGEQEPDTAAAAAGSGPVVQRFGFKVARQLEMADDVLCVRVSPDGKLLAASLLDHTIKVYYTDRSVVKWVQHLKLLQPFCVVVCVVGSGG